MDTGSGKTHVYVSILLLLPISASSNIKPSALLRIAAEIDLGMSAQVRFRFLGSPSAAKSLLAYLVSRADGCIVHPATRFYTVSSPSHRHEAFDRFR